MRSAALVGIGLLVMPVAGSSQDLQSVDYLTRDLRDAQFAVRQQVEDLAIFLRTGLMADRWSGLPGLAQARDQLVTAAARRQRPVPHARLGPAWDLVLIVEEVTPSDENRLVARILLDMALDHGSPRELEVVYRRIPTGRWELASAAGLVSALGEVGKALTDR